MFCEFSDALDPQYLRELQTNKTQTMKKFRVILVNAKTGYDIYDNFLAYASCLSYLAIQLDNLRVCYRLIEDVTKAYEGSLRFIPRSFEQIPAEARLA